MKTSIIPCKLCGLARNIRGITSRELCILELRTGERTKSGKPMTLEKIGYELGLSKERIRQILARAHKTIRMAADLGKV